MNESSAKHSSSSVRITESMIGLSGTNNNVLPTDTSADKLTQEHSHDALGSYLRAERTHGA